MADAPVAQWWGSEGGSHEYLATSNEEFKALRSKFQSDPNDESLNGKVRLAAPTSSSSSSSSSSGGGGGGSDFTKTSVVPTPTTPQPSLSEPDAIGKLKNWLLDPSKFQGGMISDTIRGAGDVVLPGSWGQLAGQTAIGAGGKVVQGAGAAVAKLGLPEMFPSLARGLTRIGLPALAAGGAAGVTGGNVVPEAEAGATGGAIANLFSISPVRNFFERFGHIKSQALWSKIRDNLGPQWADAIGADIPSMNYRLSTLGDVMDITTEDGGRKYLGKLFDTAERQIGRALKGSEFTIDKGSLDALGLSVPINKLGQGGAAQVLSPNNLVKVPVADAIALSKQLNNLAYHSKPDVTGLPIRQLANDMHERILAGVTKVDSDLASRYKQLGIDYRKLRQVKDILSSDFDKIFPTLTSGGSTFDPVRMFSNMKDNYGNFSPYDYPAQWRFFAGKEPISSGPVDTSLLGNVRPRLFGKTAGLPMGMSEQVPKFSMMRFPSGLSPYPTGATGHTTVGKVAGIMSIPTVESMMLDRMNAEETGQGQPGR